MDINKNYYATLGVLPTAEDIVIRAAYKALAQRYHPDRCQGSVEEANRRMKDINEAYNVLSNPATKAEYDKQRNQFADSGNDYFEEKANDEPPFYDPLKRDWELALKFYPDLQYIESRLARIAWRLAYAYRAYMLEIKNFEERKRIADDIENQFLKIYFGGNSEILKFAVELIKDGHKSAAKALNQAVKVFGEKINPDVVIPVIQEDFNIIDRTLLQNIRDIRSLINEIIKDGAIYGGEDKKILLIKRLGGRYVETKGFFSNSCLVVIGTINQKFIDIPAFSKWVLQVLIPLLLRLSDKQFVSFLNAASKK